MNYEAVVGLKPEFIDGVRDFIEHTMTLEIFKNNGLVRVHEMINDAFGVQGGMKPEQYFDEAPNEEARRFYDQLEESSHPLCEGSGDNDRHREHVGVSQTNRAKKKKSRRPIDPEDILGSISFVPECISHDTHLYVVPLGTADPQVYYPNYRRPVGASSTSQALPPRYYEDIPLHAIRRARPYRQLSAMRIGDSSSEKSDAMAGTPPLTQNFVHLGVSHSSTAAPRATLDDEMPALAPGQKDRLGRVMIEPDGSSWNPAKDAARALKDYVRRLFTEVYQSWSEIPNSIR
ncbi:hypothetical protein H5410_056756 [Solanum commersonii]|uniref:Uncharacterized protein n=1 Tax=Solanum commersonii TaxID=4109 RepID=A0A9J5WP00_SOLCO|nr:hypothetical protein H5410_056756 [Solanum commersonii]